MKKITNFLSMALLMFCMSPLPDFDVRIRQELLLSPFDP